MQNLPSFLLPNPEAHFMDPGTIAFIPGWIILLITIFTFAILYPGLFKRVKHKNSLINPFFFAFIIGSLMPVFDDLLTFIFGPPFAHHSVFHSLLGAALTYGIFLTISTKQIAKYALLGNLFHTFFNFYFDRVALFFPLAYQEFGLSDIVNINTYWIKAVHYPVIFVLFAWSVVKFFRAQKTEVKQ